MKRSDSNGSTWTLHHRDPSPPCHSTTFLGHGRMGAPVRSGAGRNGAGGSAPTPSGDAPRRRRWLQVQAVAGLVAPVLFAGVALVQSLLRADHDPVALAISALSVGPTGWVQDLNFIACGVLLVAFAPALHATLRPVDMGSVGPVLVAVLGLGFIASGLLPAIDGTGAFSQDEPGHAFGVWLIIVGAGLGPIALARRFDADPAWRGLATYSRYTGVGHLALAAGFAAFSRPPGSVLHGYRGLYVWILLAVLAAWLLVVAWRALAVARMADAEGRSAGG